MAADPLAPVRRSPATSALFFDVDGTLAPIAPRPDLARVPAEWLAQLERLRDRYGAAGCVSGRPMGTPREPGAVAGLLLAANHGLELDVGDGLQRPAEVEAWLPRMR